MSRMKFCAISLFTLVTASYITTIVKYRGVVGGWAGCPPSVENSENLQKFQNFISAAHVRDDVM